MIEIRGGKQTKYLVRYVDVLPLHLRVSSPKLQINTSFKICHKFLPPQYNGGERNFVAAAAATFFQNLSCLRWISPFAMNSFY